MVVYHLLVLIALSGFQLGIKSEVSTVNGTQCQIQGKCRVLGICLHFGTQLMLVDYHKFIIIQQLVATT